MENNKKKYLSHIIKDEHKSWRAGDIILISAATGSGKSHFILYDLLEYAMEQRKRILYLVNRRILKKQLLQELKDDVAVALSKNPAFGRYTVKEFIDIRTYQSLEMELAKTGCLQIQNQFYDYVIYDEAHYFYADSTFNTYTQLSYDWLRIYFDKAIQIFMSATIEAMEDKICSALPTGLYCVTGRQPSIVKKCLVPIKTRIKPTYVMQPDYSYLHLKFFNSDGELVEIVRDNVQKYNQKWLIFVDNIDRGRRIEKTLKDPEDDNIDSIDAVFIDASYQESEEALESVEIISKYKKVSNDVIISTAVMDNGISIHDNSLKNIVIMADTKEEFIQMLGRKRQFYEDVNLYICPYNEEYFENRLNQIKKTLRYYEDEGKKINAMYERNWLGELVDMEPICLPPVDTFNRLAYTYPVVAESVDAFVRRESNPSKYCNAYGVWKQQQVLLRILNDEKAYFNLKKFVYTVGGRLAINHFAISKLRSLANFYEQMITNLQEDEFAFLKTQGAWIGLNEEVVNELCEQYVGSLVEICRTHLRNSIENILGIHMSKKQCSEFRLQNRENIAYFFKLNNDYDQKIKRHIERTDENALREDMFNRCMEYAQLPYAMEVKKGRKGAVYIVAEVENKGD
jgi:hypothetical protein